MRAMLIRKVHLVRVVGFVMIKARNHLMEQSLRVASRRTNLRDLVRSLTKFVFFKAVKFNNLFTSLVIHTEPNGTRFIGDFIDGQYIGNYTGY